MTHLTLMHHKKPQEMIPTYMPITFGFESSSKTVERIFHSLTDTLFCSQQLNTMYVKAKS